MDKQISQGISVYIKKFGKWERVEVLNYFNIKNSYLVEYRAKYFDGGGYCWTNKKEMSIPKDVLIPYIIDKCIIDVIIFYLKNDHFNSRNTEEVEICSVIEKDDEYLVEYQKKYFDGGGYRWTDIIISDVKKLDINSYLRKEKIEKIKDRV